MKKVIFYEKNHKQTHPEATSCLCHTPLVLWNSDEFLSGHYYILDHVVTVNNKEIGGVKLQLKKYS